MKTLTALFDNGLDASATIRQLEASGIPADDISIVAADSVGVESFGIDQSSHLAEGGAIGAGAGGAIGALVAGLTSVGAVATGGVGLVAAGPLVAALAGAGLGAAAGSATGAAIGAFIPEHDIKFYEDAIAKGSVLVGVQCDDDERESKVKDIFEKNDATRTAHA